MHTGRWLAGAAVTALILLVTACSAPAPGQVLWVGDLETGDLSQFQDAPWNRVGGDEPRVVTNPVRSGKYAVALTIGRTTTAADGICCGSRNELLPKLRDLRPGDDLWFAFSTYLEPGFPVQAEWQLITQFKQNFDGSPPLGLYVEQGQYKIEGGNGYPGGARDFEQPISAAVTGQWEDWLVHVVFSTDPESGSVEVFRNGERALPSVSLPGGTIYPGPGGDSLDYLKTGYYRNEAIAQPGTLVLDDWRVGTTRDVVESTTSP